MTSLLCKLYSNKFERRSDKLNWDKPVASSDFVNDWSNIKISIYGFISLPYFCISEATSSYEPCHEKTCFCHMRTIKAHPRSLISAFVVHCLDSTIPLVCISEISSLRLASVVAQTGLRLTWSQIMKTGFLMTRLIFEPSQDKCTYSICKQQGHLHSLGPLLFAS